MQRAFVRRLAGNASQLWAMVLIIVSMCLALPAQAQKNQGFVPLVPYEVLDDSPDCAGRGKIAYRVAVELQQAKARFGFENQKAPRVCEIMTRRGVDFQRIVIPCPDAADELLPDPDMAGFPLQVDLKAEVVACLSVDSLRVIDSSWTVTAQTPMGLLTQQGNLSTPGFTAILTAPRSRFDKQSHWTKNSNYPYVVLTWDGVDTSLRTDAGVAIRLSTYHVVMPVSSEDGACLGDSCPPTDVTVLSIIGDLGDRSARDLIDFVEGR